MERRSRLTAIGAIMGVLASLITIFVFISGFNSLRDIKSAIRSTAPIVSAGTSSVAPMLSPASLPSKLSPLVASALQQVEIGRNVQYLVQLLGPPVVMRHEPPDAATGRPELLYYRFSFEPDCSIQLFATSEQSVTAFVVHGCEYSFPYHEWTVGQTAFSSIGEPKTRLVGGDGRDFAYVEEFYFGRSGHYHDFFFAAPWPVATVPPEESSLSQVDRSRTIRAVAISECPCDADVHKSEHWNEFQANLENWNKFIAYVVGVPVPRLEGM